ncbi:MAG TPA: peptidoglycan-associated lipoprotein Pal [Thermoanaerobaculia bacterium]|nr:peptidoglycan-associated lipoprotein Pal [Thermoanaerobaculia bacterium]
MNRNRGRLFLLVLIILSISLAFGCRTRAKKAEVVPEPVPPVVEPEVETRPSVPVEPPTDFVREPEVAAEDLSGSTEELTDRAQRMGWVRDVFFEFDSFALSADAQDALAVTASWLKTHPEFSLLIEGHCDERGTQQYNLALGDRRANVAKDYIVTLGVPSSRVRTISYGEERPFSTGSDESAWAQNRRAHMTLVR